MVLEWAPGKGGLLQGHLAFLYAGDGDVMSQTTEAMELHVCFLPLSVIFIMGGGRTFKVGRMELTSLRRN